MPEIKDLPAFLEKLQQESIYTKDYSKPPQIKIIQTVPIINAKRIPRKAKKRNRKQLAAMMEYVKNNPLPIFGKPEYLKY